MNTADKAVIPALLRAEYEGLSTMTTETIDGALFPSHIREHAIDDYEQLASIYTQWYAESVHAGRPNLEHRAVAERCRQNAASLRVGGPITLGGRES